jgi:hypothetical protein
MEGRKSVLSLLLVQNEQLFERASISPSVRIVIPVPVVLKTVWASRSLVALRNMGPVKAKITKTNQKQQVLYLPR